MIQNFLTIFNASQRFKYLFCTQKCFSQNKRRTSLTNKKPSHGKQAEEEDKGQNTSTNQQLALMRKSIVLYIDFSGVSAQFLPDISLCK
jgi:hypothetical protein